MVLRFLTAGDGGGLESKVAWTECAFIVVCVDSESNFTRHGIKCEEENKLPPDSAEVNRSFLKSFSLYVHSSRGVVLWRVKSVKHIFFNNFSCAYNAASTPFLIPWKVWHLWLLCYNCSVWASWIVWHGNFGSTGNT